MKKRILNACAGLIMGISLLACTFNVAYGQTYSWKQEVKTEKNSVDEPDDMAYTAGMSSVRLDKRMTGNLARFDKVVFNKKTMEYILSIIQEMITLLSVIHTI